jgi:hypothetical protein
MTTRPKENIPDYRQEFDDRRLRPGDLGLLIVFIFFVIFVSSAFFWHAFDTSPRVSAELMTKSYMSQMFFSLEQYARENGGRFPDSLTTVDDGSDPHLFVFPGNQQFKLDSDALRRIPLQNRCDYGYNPGLKIDDPGQKILLYLAKPQNGLYYVVTVDGQFRHLSTTAPAASPTGK